MQFRQNQTIKSLQLKARSGKYSRLVNKSQCHTDSDKLQINEITAAAEPGMCAYAEGREGTLVIGYRVL